MTSLEEITGAHRRGLDALIRSREESSEWADQERRRLDGAFVNPLVEDGKRLLAVLERSSAQISAARAELVRDPR